MRQSAVAFRCKGLTLEGVIASPPLRELPGPFPGAVVCHPHPIFGGNMDNGLVVALCQALVQSGFVTFRFNFRGVGQSEGESTKGEKEHEDVGAALDFLRKWPDATRDRLGLVGYSFGASMVLTGLPRYKAAKALALISPPLTSLDSPGLRKDNRPMIFIGGDKDRLVPFSSLKDRLDSIRPEAELQMVPGADHSWRGHEGEAAQQATGFLQRYLKGDLKK